MPGCGRRQLQFRDRRPLPFAARYRKRPDTTAVAPAARPEKPQSSDLGKSA